MVMPQPNTVELERSMHYDSICLFLEGIAVSLLLRVPIMQLLGPFGCGDLELIGLTV